MAHDESTLKRELLQARLVSAIFSDSVSRRFRVHVALKGGLAMRLMQGSHRATKDIDLQSDGTFPVEAARKWMTNLIRQTAKDLGLANVRVTEPKQTDTTQRWKAVYATASGVESHLTIEMSRRGLPDPEYVCERPVGGPERIPVLARTYSPDALLVSKMAALPRQAARDVYDLDLLIRSEIRPSPELLRGIGEERLRTLAAEVWQIVDAMGFRQAQDQLVPFLPREARDAFTETAWQAMQMNVAGAVQRWAAEALGGPAGLGAP